MHQLRPIDLLARVGGDEFNVILPCPENFDRVHSVTSRLKACFDDPFYLDGKFVTGSASFGFSRYPQDGVTAEELTRVADHAMYMCKHDANIAREASGSVVITPDELGLRLAQWRLSTCLSAAILGGRAIDRDGSSIRLDHPTLFNRPAAENCG